MTPITDRLREWCEQKKAAGYRQLDALNRQSVHDDYERGRQTGRVQVASEILDLLAALVAALTPTPARTTTDEDDLTRAGDDGQRPVRLTAADNEKA